MLAPPNEGSHPSDDQNSKSQQSHTITAQQGSHLVATNFLVDFAKNIGHSGRSYLKGRLLAWDYFRHFRPQPAYGKTSGTLPWWTDDGKQLGRVAGHSPQS
jgi:hypothetical protein